MHPTKARVQLARLACAALPPCPLAGLAPLRTPCLPSPWSVPSKVNPTTDRVPTTALTVTLARVALAWVVNALGEHATVVPDVHDAVPHRMSPE